MASQPGDRKRHTGESGKEWSTLNAPVPIKNKKELEAFIKRLFTKNFYGY
jgi:hypothetical protein